MIRFSLLLLACGAAFGAHASFDLLLMADNNVDFANAKFAKVHRYDPINGAYFGSFGSFPEPISGLAADVSKSLCYIQTTTSLCRTNYSTGEVLASVGFSAGGLALSADGKTIYQLTTGGTLRSVDAATFAINKTVGLGISAGAIVMTSSGVLVLHDKTNNQLKSYDATTLGLLSSIPAPTGLTVTTMTTEGATGRIVVSGQGPSLASTVRISVNAAGAFGSSITTSFTAAYLGGIIQSAPRHDGFYLAATHPVAGARVYGFTTTVAQTAFMPFSQVVTPGPMATVLAPEPGSLLVAGLGLVALIRRRR